MLLGMHLRDVYWHKQTAFQAIGFDRIDEVMNFVNNKYVDDVEKEKLMNETINGLLQKLDPHSSYIPVENTQEGYEKMQGKFDGIGIEFQIINDTAIVVGMLKNSPAKYAGMEIGDKIFNINSKKVTGKNINSDSLRLLLKGSKGTKVNVKILRNTDTIQYTIYRNTIQVASIPYVFKLNDTTLFVKIDEFTQQTYREFYDSLIQLKNDTTKHLIIDLRNNPGGYLSEAINILDEIFEAKKLLLYTDGSHKQRKEYISKRKGIFENYKISVLVNENSASASEIIAGAIQDWDRGTIIGQETFGKGLVQEEYELSNGSILRLTIARYYTPSGRCIQRDYSEGTDKYYENAEKRLLHKDSSNINKSINTNNYYTLLKHRTVKGKGGISPDIIIKNNLQQNSFDLNWYNKINEIIYSNYHTLPRQEKDINTLRKYIIQKLQTKYKADKTILLRHENLINDFVYKICLGETTWYKQKMLTDEFIKSALKNDLNL
jgi:carboxyl-terminal processing protease